MKSEPDLTHIRMAAERIGPFVHRTPILTCRTLDEIFGASLFFKCENFQKGGAFKIRGACNAVFSLADDRLSAGVATHSSGNHAAALALAARWRKIKAYVVMPDNAPAVKRAAVADYGAKIVLCPPTLRDREAHLDDVVKQTGATAVHPYNDYDIIAGQGTAALELCEKIRELDVIMAPVGGGGLLSGSALAASSLNPHIDIVGAEPANADDACRSLQAGRIIPVTQPDTIADGLRTSLGSLTFPIIQRHVKQIVTVSEAKIVAGMRLLWERMKLVVEPSAAVPLGALLSDRIDVTGKRVGLILSGGNVDLASLPFADDKR